MVLDDLARQHETDARAVRLRREERHEQVIRPSEPRAVILDLDENGAAIATPPHAHAAPLARGFDGAMPVLDDRQSTPQEWLMALALPAVAAAALVVAVIA